MEDVLNWSHHSKHRDFDVDYSGHVMPPPEAVAGTYKNEDGKFVKVAPLTDEDKLTLVRWIDLGCPIDRDYDPQRKSERGVGWLLDEGRPTLTLASPQAGFSAEQLSSILVGMYDYGTGLDMDSFRVTADFPIDGIPPGENLAARFKPKSDGVWQLVMEKPISDLAKGRLTVVVKDHQGNTSWIDRTFSAGK